MTPDTPILVQFTLLAVGATGALVALQIAQDQYSHAVVRLLLGHWTVMAYAVLIVLLPTASLFFHAQMGALALHALTVVMMLLVVGFSGWLIFALGPEKVACFAPGRGRVGTDACFGVATGCARRFDFAGAGRAVAGYFGALAPMGRWNELGLCPTELADQLADMLILALREGDRNVLVPRWHGEFRRWFSDDRHLAGATRETLRTPVDALLKTALACSDDAPVADLCDALVLVGAAYSRRRTEAPFDYGLAYAALVLKRLEAWPPGTGLWKGGRPIEERVGDLVSARPEFSVGCGELLAAAGLVAEFAGRNLRSPASAFLVDAGSSAQGCPPGWEPTWLPDRFVVRGRGLDFQPPAGTSVVARTVTDPRLVQVHLEYVSMFAAGIRAALEA